MHQILFRSTARVFPLLIVLIAPLFAPGVLKAQEAQDQLFDYSGNMFVQTWYRARDLTEDRPEDIDGFDTSNQYESLCPRPDPTPDEVDNTTTSRCREEEDFTRMRLRADFALRPSSMVDILYGLEIGYIRFGEDSGNAGPGSGGQGSGATNLETRQLIMRLHNEADTFAGQVGVFSIGTPEGIVLASSGAGARFDWDKQDWSSSFKLDLIRSEDRSKIDDDSNGFSDDNFNDINLSAASWNYTGVRWLDSTLYGVYRGDDNPSTSDGDGEETSRIYWAGLYLKFKLGRWTLLLHGVGNWGRFERPDKQEYLSEPARLLVQDELKERGYLIEDDDDIQAPFDPRQNFFVALPRKKYKVNAGAGHAAIGFQATDRLEVIASAAGGSGRLGPEPDNRSSFTRADQFRVVSPAFQHSEIAVDSSGGYSVFSLGKLTGVMTRGITFKLRLVASLEAQLGFFDTEAYRTPVMEYNRFHTRYPFYLKWNLTDDDRIEVIRDDDISFTQHPGIRKESNSIGQEVNLKLTWRIHSDLVLEGKAAFFRAGDGYRALRDVEYGSQIGEAAISLKQSF